MKFGLKRGASFALVRTVLALEMARDHLERIPDYYTYLLIMERGCAEKNYRRT